MQFSGIPALIFEINTLFARWRIAGSIFNGVSGTSVSGCAGGGSGSWLISSNSLWQSASTKPDIQTRTLRRLNGTSPTAHQALLIFASGIALGRAFLYASAHSNFFTLIIPYWMISSSSRDMYCFNGEKTPTSSGWQRCDEWGGIRRIIIPLSIQ